MNEDPVLPAEATVELLRRCWYSHDAHWFMSVAGEFGLEAANRLNRQVCRRLGNTETLRLMKALGVSQVSTVREMVRFVDTGCRLLVGPLMEFEMRVLNDQSYEMIFHRCFVQENVVKAGIGPSYVCAVFDRLQGWHDALNLPLTEEPPASLCAKFQGRECRRGLTVR